MTSNTAQHRRIEKMYKQLPASERASLRKLAASYAAFRLTYYSDPTGFVRDCIKWRPGEEPTAYQYEILGNVMQFRRYSVRGPHGLGKTAMAAWVILWFALTRDVDNDWKVACTASAWRQLTKFLWPEVQKWAGRLDWEKIGRKPLAKLEMHSTSLKLTTGEAFTLVSGDASSIEGAHADEIMYVFDEAKAIKDEIWDAAEGALSTPGKVMAFCISTPGEPIGRFYDIQSHKPGFEDWHTRHITKEDAIQSGRISKEWADQRKKQWGEKSAVYQNRVEGNFAASDIDGIISLSDVERAIERWKERSEAGDWEPLVRVSVDVGRGGDPTVIARRHGTAIKEFETSHLRTIMPVTGRVKGILEAPGNEAVDAVIDVTGIGAGVVDRLREFKHLLGRTIAFVAGGKTAMKDKTNELGFVNQRAWAWWTLRELLQDDMIDLPDNDQMIGELTAPKYQMQSGGRIKVEEKEEIKKRIGRSTDYADAVVQAFWKRNAGPSFDAIEEYAAGESMAEEAVPADIKAYAEM